jgi:glycosyltransferase involved in cell wall biosynthesis
VVGEQAGDDAVTGDAAGEGNGHRDHGHTGVHRRGQHGKAATGEGTGCGTPLGRQGGEVDGGEAIGEVLDETANVHGRHRRRHVSWLGRKVTDGHRAVRSTAVPGIADLAAGLRAGGVERIHVLAWRDLDDPDAGGSEVHADELMTRWSAAGLDVLHRTSAAVGATAQGRRHGYAVIRRGSRYGVFPRAAAAEVLGQMGRSDALVEVWNGVPWFSPLWYRRPRLTIVHHVHGPMWNQVMPTPLAAIGRALEARIAPPVYRRGATVTPSESTREELLELGFRPDRVTAVPNGVEEYFTPGGRRASTPLVLAVGRFAPVKRFHLALEAAQTARRTVPGLRMRLVGDGPLAGELHRWVGDHDASEWVEFAGYVERHRLPDEYRRAWVVLSASLAEGWGLALTEAAACGTPAVATDIRGHRSSVVDGQTGLLAPPERLGPTLAGVLGDSVLRNRLGDAARERARTLTWERTAVGVLGVLRDEVARSRR